MGVSSNNGNVMNIGHKRRMCITLSQNLMQMFSTVPNRSNFTIFLLRINALNSTNTHENKEGSNDLQLPYELITSFIGVGPES